MQYFANKYSRRQFLSMVGSGVLVSSCGGTDSAKHFFSPPPEPDTLVFYDINDPATLDPARSWGLLDGKLIGLIFSNLVRFDRRASIQADLASQWNVSDDGTRYSFQLNPKARFSNGRTVISDDVKYSFERVLDPSMASSSAWVLERIERIEIEDDHRLTIILDQPFAPFINLLAMPAASIVPGEEIEKAEKENRPFGERPVGSGPWVLREWRHDQYIALERNEAYWGRKPAMPKLKMRIINNPFTAIAEFESGHVSVIDRVPIPEIKRWRTHPQWKRYTMLFPMLNTDMLVFNCERPPLNDPAIRKAFCMAVETPLVLQCVRVGAGTVSHGPIPPGLAGYREGAEKIPYDPEQAKAIIHQTDLPQRGVDIVFPYNESFIRTTGEVIQALWKRLGITARLHQLEWVTYRKYLREGRFDMGWRNWYADYPDGDNYLFPLFHSSQIGSGNMSRFNDPEVDALIEQSQREMKVEKRNQLLETADALIYEKSPALFLWHQAKYEVHQPWLKNYTEPLVFNGTRYLDEKIIDRDPSALKAGV